MDKEFIIKNTEACECILQTLSLLSNKTRLHILCILSNSDYCVGEIGEIVGGKTSNISQQLKMLTMAGYLEKRRSEKNIFYHLKDEKIKKLLDFFRDNFTKS
ncbi:MAG: winged helix-turn-helix transcriptional regulator [Spirochaetales bacterium]|nr:winged helix-turn-helix transcriptional regulator [Spirochaetales bacterium]